MGERPIQERQREPYWKKIRSLEKKCFTEFQSETVYHSENAHYTYFAPSWHFKTGLITERDVQTLSTHSQTKLLSVGAGAAYLERLLVQLGVPQDHITLSDIDSSNLPPEFQSKIFDMWSEWPQFTDIQYDLIIFPESVLINHKFPNDEDDAKKQSGLYHLLVQALQHLAPTGTIRMNVQLGYMFNVEDLKNKLLQQGYPITFSFHEDLIEIINQASPS